jgi:hypothetical protein
MNSRFAIGIELGRRADGTALAVVECVVPAEFESAGYCPPELLKFRVIDLHRFPPGTSYEDMAKYVSKVLDKLKLMVPHAQIYLVVDQTAVGGPMVGLFQRLVGKEVYRVVIEGRHYDTYSNGVYYVPKQILLSGMDVSFELEYFKIAEDLDETQNLVQEFIQYRDQPTSAASLNGDTWREHPSDDLVFATGLACWKLRDPSYFRYDRL